MQIAFEKEVASNQEDPKKGERERVAIMMHADPIL